MYSQPASLLVDNPFDRCLLNSTMLKQFKRDADGGLTLLIQTESPGQAKEADWLLGREARQTPAFLARPADSHCADLGIRRGTVSRQIVSPSVYQFDTPL